VHKHQLDLLSLVSGLLFAGLAAAYIVGAYTDIRLEAQYAFPIALVTLGLAGLAGSLLGQRRSDRARHLGDDDLAARP
jgi:hypothetical protein